MRATDIDFDISGSNEAGKRLVIAVTTGTGDHLHRGELNTNSETSRKRFFSALAKKTGVSADELFQAHDNRLVRLADEADDQAEYEAGESAKAESGGKKSQATLLVEMTADVDLWHNDDHAYATIQVDQHRETWPVRSKGFKRWLSRRFFLRAQKAPSSQALQDALGVIEGVALYEGAEHAVHTRLAEHDGVVYLDLCNPTWQAVEITSAGWRVVDDPPVKFRRAKAMKELPSPVKDGSVDDLRHFVNTDDGDWPLVAAWLLASMRPVGPYPVLCLHGEQGSAKSTAARVLRSLVDPNTSPLRSEPREPRDLMIAANNSWIVALDNLSRIQPWLSDAICRLATGGGFSTRTLYENDEETIFDAMRPVIITGIEELATRGDLLDRSLLINLPTISEARRRPEKEFWRAFSEVQPSIFGAMLTAVSEALANLPSVSLPRLPRMADFATWATAGECALGFASGTFMTTYVGNREAGNELAIEASPVGKIVLEMVLNTAYWTGRATELLKELDDLADDKTRRLKSWPQTPQRLSGILKRLAPNLRALGVDVGIDRNRRRRSITLTRMDSDSSVTAVTTVTAPRNAGAAGDANGGRVTLGDAGEGDKNPENDAGDAGDVEMRPHSSEPAQSRLTPAEEEALAEFLKG